MKSLKALQPHLFISLNIGHTALKRFNDFVTITAVFLAVIAMLSMILFV